MSAMRAPLLDDISAAQATGASAHPMSHLRLVADDADEDFEEDDDKFYDENDGTDEDDNDDDDEEADDDEDVETWQVSVSIPPF